MQTASLAEIHPQAQIFLQSPFPAVTASKSESNSDILNKEEKNADLRINLYAGGRGGEEQKLDSFFSLNPFVCKTTPSKQKPEMKKPKMDMEMNSLYTHPQLQSQNQTQNKAQVSP